MPPGLDPASERFGRPEAHFWLRFGGQAEVVFGQVIHRDAFGNDLVPTADAVQTLAGFAVVLKTFGIEAPLMIEHDHRCASIDLTVVAKYSRLPLLRASHHAHPNAALAARFARDAIEVIPNL